MRQAGAPGCGIPDDPASDAGPSGIRASPKEGILFTKAALRILVGNVKTWLFFRAHKEKPKRELAKPAHDRQCQLSEMH